MAGRPRKDINGDPLVPMSMSMTKQLRTEIRRAAEEHGMYQVDYIAALVATDRNRPDLAPATIQEVLPLPRIG